MRANKLETAVQSSEPFSPGTTWIIDHEWDPKKCSKQAAAERKYTYALERFNIGERERPIWAISTAMTPYRNILRDSKYATNYRSAEPSAYIVAFYANGRARKLATPRVVCNARCCQFSLQHGLAASVGLVVGKTECCRQSLGTLWRFAVVSSGES